MARLNIDRQNKLEPIRVAECKKVLEELGFDVRQVSDSQLVFEYKGAVVNFYPYSGWHSGKTIKDGRGFKKLINQLKK